MENKEEKNEASRSSVFNSSRRLFFDRRYGWVFDEFNHPSEEALAGGHGMFCILPLANAFFCNTASRLIDSASNLAAEVFERRDLLSPKSLQAASAGESGLAVDSWLDALRDCQAASSA